MTRNIQHSRVEFLKVFILIAYLYRIRWPNNQSNKINDGKVSLYNLSILKTTSSLGDLKGKWINGLKSSRTVVLQIKSAPMGRGNFIRDNTCALIFEIPIHFYSKPRTTLQKILSSRIKVIIEDRKVRIDFTIL